MVHRVFLMNSSTEKIKEEFAKRIHKAMDDKNYPVRGRARVLSREFDVSDKGAGKWLKGEAIPETSKIPLLNFLSNNQRSWHWGFRSIHNNFITRFKLWCHTHPVYNKREDSLGVYAFISRICFTFWI